MDPNITPDEYRNGIRNLMIEYLGVQWARKHIAGPYGSLNRIPNAALRQTYIKATADARDVEAQMERRAAKAEEKRSRGPATPPDWPRVFSAELAAAYLSLSVSGLHRLRRAGGFPHPVSLAPGRVGWLREHLDAWLDVRTGLARPLTGNMLDDLPDA